MKLHHVAFWTNDISRLSNFYREHFKGEIAFEHKDGDFSCQFMRVFGNVHLEFMHQPKLQAAMLKDRVGHSHISIEVESKEEVDRLTDYFVARDVALEKNKVQYDDGFYESSVFDPDGNIIELAFVDRTVNGKV